MEQAFIFLILLLTVLSVLVIVNTYNIYKMTQKKLETQNLMDMQEFNELHPLIKELYKEAIVNGVFYIQTLIMNDIIKMNDIDKWYNANKNEIMELIGLVKEVGLKNYKKNKAQDAKISSVNLSNFKTIDLKSLIEKVKKYESIDTLKKDTDVKSYLEFYDLVKNKSENTHHTYNVIR